MLQRGKPTRSTTSSRRTSRDSDARIAYQPPPTRGPCIKKNATKHVGSFSLHLKPFGLAFRGTGGLPLAEEMTNGNPGILREFVEVFGGWKLVAAFPRGDGLNRNAQFRGDRLQRDSPRFAPQPQRTSESAPCTPPTLPLARFSTHGRRIPEANEMPTSAWPAWYYRAIPRQVRKSPRMSPRPHQRPRFAEKPTRQTHSHGIASHRFARLVAVICGKELLL